MRYPSTVRSVPWLILVTFACSGGSEQRTLGGLDVRVDSDPARITVTAADGTVVLDSLAGGKAGSATEPPHVATAFREAQGTFEFQVGAFKIEEKSLGKWRGVERFSDLSASSDAISFRNGDVSGSGRITSAVQGHLAITLTGPGDDNRASFALRCDPDEHFLGFGGQTASVDHRGQTVPLWVQEDGITKAPVDTYDFGVWFLMGRLHSTHTPMPIYVSSRGYALLLDTPARSVFSMCSEDEGVVRIEAWESELRLHLFYGPSPAEAIERLTAHLGRPQLPPTWTFAPWLDAIFGSDNVRRVANDLRAAGVPSSVIWTEDWRGGNQEGLGYTLEEDWELDRDLYPDFETLADELHDLGYKFLVYNNTFLDSEVATFDEAVAGGYTIRDAGGDVYLFTGVKFNDSTLLDLSNPEAVDWAKGKYREGLEAGADGYMADFAEWLPTDAVLASGESAELVHNLYPVEWARLNRELFDDMFEQDGIERLFFVRSAYLGSQPLVSVVWAGDQQTDFSRDDGLASVIPMGVGLGVTGFPYFGHDIAGYMSQLTEPVSRELWYRWVTFGALSPVMRTHHGRDASLNWNWETDIESTTHFKRWATFHIRLFPYLYALAERSAQSGLPMLRPLALDYPSFEPGWSLEDQYMLGDRLIVAPVVEQGVDSRTVVLPPGTFYELTSRQRVDVGDAPVEVSAALEEIPVFVPAGALLVLLPDGVDTLAPADPGSGAVTLSDAGDDREIWLWPGGDSDLTEAGGELSYLWRAGSLGATVTSATYGGETIPIQTDADGTFFEVVGPGNLLLDGEARLQVTGGAPDRQITVRLR